MNIIEAMDDPALFGPHFKGASWDPWRCLLTAAFALPMTPDQLAVYRQHTGRVTAPTRPFKEVALVAGRRSGKSRILAYIATYLATFRDYQAYLAPGEVATIAVVAADRRQARSVMSSAEFRARLGMARR